MLKIPVFTYKLDPDQVGNGIYRMVACFVTLGVHVHYSFEAHSENENLQFVGPVIACDGSCRHYQGHMDDFATERHHSDYEVDRIIVAATTYNKS